MGESARRARLAIINADLLALQARKNQITRLSSIVRQSGSKSETPAVVAARERAAVDAAAELAHLLAHPLEPRTPLPPAAPPKARGPKRPAARGAPKPKRRPAPAPAAEARDPRALDCLLAALLVPYAGVDPLGALLASLLVPY